MAKLSNIRIYEKARTSSDRFTATCATVEYSNVYNRLYRLGWKVMRIKTEEAAPKRVQFIAEKAINPNEQ